MKTGNRRANFMAVVDEYIDGKEPPLPYFAYFLIAFSWFHQAM
jgi:hypothetical protein